MKNFITVIRFELRSYLRSKNYLLAAVLSVVVIMVGLFLPSIFNRDDWMWQEEVKQTTYAIVDEHCIIDNFNVFEKQMPFGKMVLLKEEETLKKGIKSGEYEAGMIVKSPTKIQYVINNTVYNDQSKEGFEKAMAYLYREKQFENQHLDFKWVNEVYSTPIETEQIVLGKDSVSNVAYTYILVFLMYTLFIFYSQSIATEITTEKSYRTMEVLITSTKPTYLFLGKIIAGAVAAFLQMGFIIGITKFGYYLNADSWHHRLDFVFNVPVSVLLCFFVFGIVGFILFTSILSALGALATKVEEVNKSTGGVTFIFILLFIVAIYTLKESNGLLIQVASFIPISSYMLMFIRVALGTVSLGEVLVSFALLVGTTVIISSMSAKIYGLGVRRYHESISFWHALDLIFKKEDVDL